MPNLEALHGDLAYRRLRTLIELHHYHTAHASFGVMTSWQRILEVLHSLVIVPLWPQHDVQHS